MSLKMKWSKDGDKTVCGDYLISPWVFPAGTFYQVMIRRGGCTSQQYESIGECSPLKVAKQLAVNHASEIGGVYIKV